MSFEKDVYEIKEIWDESWFTESEAKRIKALTNEIIATKPLSILDAGCGNGLLLNSLKKEKDLDGVRLVGAERSKVALGHVLTEKYECSIDNMPFEDNEFDMVTCCEVLEHLPTEVFNKAIKEISRIAAKGIVISVPFNEDLNKSLVSCPTCKTKFNPEYHVGSFDENRMSNLFNDFGFSNSKVDFISVQSPRFLSLIKKVLHKKTFPEHTICPMCGYNKNELLKSSKRGETTKKNSSSKNAIKSVWPYYQRPKWVYGIYKKSS